MRFEEQVPTQTIDLFPASNYRPPGNDHGTHVAGILAANWLVPDPEVPSELRPVLVGICPDLNLWDMRVLDERGLGDEFGVVAGLRLVQEINRRAGRLRIHGVNLGLWIAHHVANFACGWTPV